MEDAIVEKLKSLGRFFNPSYVIVYPAPNYNTFDENPCSVNLQQDSGE